jgi:hypothetical protein
MGGSKLYSFSQTLHEHKGDYAPGGSAPKRKNHAGSENHSPQYSSKRSPFGTGHCTSPPPQIRKGTTLKKERTTQAAKITSVCVWYGQVWQRNWQSVYWCLGALELNKGHCKKNEEKIPSGWRAISHGVHMISSGWGWCCRMGTHLEYTLVHINLLVHTPVHSTLLPHTPVHATLLAHTHWCTQHCWHTHTGAHNIAGWYSHRYTHWYTHNFVGTHNFAVKPSRGWNFL